MKRRVIIDCDPGIDDSMAIMLALRSEEIELAGITLTAGNCPLESCFSNVKKVLHHMGCPDIPVCLGADRPLKVPFVNAKPVHGCDGLGGSDLPEVPGAPDSRTALDFLKEELGKGGCSVIALGPMTNLAQLIMESPESFDAIEELVSMGGSFKSHGNISPVAEFNYWCDPDAAALVYDHLAKSGGHITMIGLDVTRRIVLTPSLLSLMERLNPREGAFIRKITGSYFDFHWKSERLIGCIVNDPLAVAYFLDHEMCRGIEAYTAVARDGICRGQCVVDEKAYYHRQANAAVMTDTDAARFFRLFFRRVLGASEADLDLIDRCLMAE